MADYVSLLSNTTSEDHQDSKCDEGETEELTSDEEKEISETIEDLISIQNQDILKRNLTVIVKENIILKKRVKQLEGSQAFNQASSLSFHIDCDGKSSGEEVSNTHDQIEYNTTSELEVMGSERTSSSSEPVTKSGNSCFNCSGDHNLADCKEEKDFRRIAKNRREFQAKNASLSSARYHVDEPQKFGHLSPGLPSKKLSEALRLRKDHLPEYIYRLRELGYPPGWMKHAEISQSGVELYLEDGRKADPSGGEEGEVRDREDTMKYDTNKLVAWPGFNVEMPKYCKDESNRYRVRPMSKVYCLRDMKRDMRGKEQTGYKKGKMQDVSTDNSQVIDMDTSITSNDDEVPIPGEEDAKEETDTEAVVFSTPLKQAASSGNVVKTDTGTPIVESYSPFNNLPKYANFGKDMSEHIVFENLPDYTGNWEKMSGLIKRIKQRKDIDEKDS